MNADRIRPAPASRFRRGGPSRRGVIAGGLACLASRAAGQGFAGLGTDAEGYALPRPDPAFAFPSDHGAHPAFRIEWWYLTANLEDGDGRPYGIQWTLFRTALRPPAPDTPETGWQVPQLWMGHAGLTTPERHFHAERLARGGVGQAGVTPAPFAAWIDEWRLAGPAGARDGARDSARDTAHGTARDGPADGDALDRLTVSAAAPEFAYRIGLRAEGPLVFHGADGYSVKSPEGQASYYYSQPFYRAEGTLDLAGREIAVTGRAWLDREWSSQPLSETQDGWDWISLHLDSGEKLMGFRLRDRRGASFTSATHIAPDGGSTSYSDGALTLTPHATTAVAGRTVPTGWRATLPARGIDVTLEAVNPRAWMGTSFPYWEGPVRIAGSHGGRGYLEMTGYPED